jgi:hypothetical protein
MSRLRSLAWAVYALSAALLLSGCAMTRMIESYVSSFTGSSGAVTNVGFRFDRLPSQPADSPAQKHLEAVTTQALTRVGLARNDDKPLYAVQVTVRVEQTTRNPARVLRNSGFYVGADGLLWEAPPLLFMEPPWYMHTVVLLLRNTTTGQVDYESTAVHEGPWSDTNNLLPVMLEATLRDYPNPPTGPRRVTIELVPDPGVPRP